MLSYIFGAMILLSLITAAVTGKMEALSASVLDSAKNAVELMVSMCGMLCLWSGFMEIAKRAGVMEKLSGLFAPLLRKIFPAVESSSDAFSYMSMNISANLMGLGNAATPLGLKAMKELKKENDSDTASDSMLNFVIMNTASIQLLPTMMATLRKSYGSVSPFDVVFCIWVASAAALFVGLFSSRIITSFRRRRKPAQKEEKSGFHTVRLSAFSSKKEEGKARRKIRAIKNRGVKGKSWIL